MSPAVESSVSAALLALRQAEDAEQMQDFWGETDKVPNYFFHQTGLNCLKSPQETLNWLWSSLNFILTPHILPTLAIEAINMGIGDYYPFFFYNVLPSPLSQQKHYKSFTAHRLEEKICWLRMWLISCSYYLWLKAGEYFSLDNFQYFVFMDKLVLCI